MCTSIMRSVPGERLKTENFDYYLVVDNLTDPNNEFYPTANPALVLAILNNNNMGYEDRVRDALAIIDVKIFYLNVIHRILNDENLPPKTKVVAAIAFIEEQKRTPGTIEQSFADLYNNQADVVIQPTVGALRGKTSSDPKRRIYTNIFLFENFKEPLTKDEFDIRQHFTIDVDGNNQLSYYILFKRPDADRTRERGNMYRMHKLSIKSQDFASLVYDPTGENTRLIDVDISEIVEVIVFFINVNPEASRGTSTTVKDVNVNLC